MKLGGKSDSSVSISRKPLSSGAALLAGDFGYRLLSGPDSQWSSVYGALVKTTIDHRHRTLKYHSDSEEYDVKKTSRILVKDLFQFFSSFEPMSRTLSLKFSTASEVTGNAGHRQNIVDIALGFVSCHPFEFSPFSDFIIDAMAGVAPVLAPQLGLSRQCPTLTISTARGTLIAQVSNKSVQHTLLDNDVGVRFMDVSFHLIQASNSMNLLSCKGLGASGKSLLCRVLSDDEVRCPIKCHEKETVDSSLLQSALESSSEEAQGSYPYRTSDILMSGWMIKWPMKSQFYGTSTKRFFLLLAAHKKAGVTNAILAYWTEVPDCMTNIVSKQNSGSALDDSQVRMTVMSQNGLQGILGDVFIPMNTMKGFIVINGFSSVQMKRSSVFGGRFLQVLSPTDELHVECDSVESELSWYSKLSAVINYQRTTTELEFPNRKLFATAYSKIDSTSKARRELADKDSVDGELSIMKRQEIDSLFPVLVISSAGSIHDSYGNGTRRHEVQLARPLDELSRSLDSPNKISSPKRKTHSANTTMDGGGHITPNLKSTIKVIEVSEDQCISDHIKRCDGVFERLAPGSQLNAPARSTTRNISRTKDGNHAIKVSSLLSNPGTSLEEPLTMSFSPSEEGYDPVLETAAERMPTLSSASSAGNTGTAETSVRPFPGVSNTKEKKLKGDAVSVDSGVDLDDNTIFYERHQLVHPKTMSENEGDQEQPTLDGAAAVLVLQTRETRTINNELFYLTEFTDGVVESLRSGKISYVSEHYVHMMDGSNLTYAIRIAPLEIACDAASSANNHSRDQTNCVVNLKHFIHRSYALSLPRSFGAPLLSLRVFLFSGDHGFVGMGWAGNIAGEWSTVRAFRSYAKPVGVEVIQRDGDSERHSFSSVDSPLRAGDNGTTVFLHVSKLTRDFYKSEKMEGLSVSIKSCKSYSMYNEAILNSRALNCDGHRDDGMISSLSLSPVSVSHSCGTFPCLHCSSDSIARNQHFEIPLAYSWLRSLLIISSDDLGVLCLWNSLTLATAFFVSKSADSTLHSSPVPNSSTLVDAVQLRSNHCLLQRLVLGAPITGTQFCPDGVHVVVLTATQALLYKIKIAPPSLSSAQGARLEIVTVLDDSTNKDVLFRLRYFSDVSSSPGQIRLWKVFANATEGSIVDTGHDNVGGPLGRRMGSDESPGTLRVPGDDYAVKFKSYIQFSDIAMNSYVKDADRTLLGVRNRSVVKALGETGASTDSLKVLYMEEFVSWIGDGFGVISSFQNYKNKICSDNQSFHEPAPEKRSNENRWNMDDFEEYIRLRNRVKKWWRENSSRVLILHEKSRVREGSSAGGDPTVDNGDQDVWLAPTSRHDRTHKEKRENKPLTIPPGGACGHPTPSSHTFAPAIKDDYHHSFRTENTTEFPSSSGINDSSNTFQQTRILKVPPLFFEGMTLIEQADVEDPGVVSAGRLPIPRVASPKALQSNNDPNNVDKSSPLFAAAVTKEFRGHVLVKFVLQTPENNPFFEHFSGAGEASSSSTKNTKTFEELCAFQMICSTIYQLYESFGSEYLEALRLSLSADLSNELFQALEDRVVDDDRTRGSNGFQLRNPITKDALKNLNNSDERDTLHHVVNGFVSRLLSVPSYSLQQISETISALTAVCDSNVEASELKDVKSLLDCLETVRDRVSILKCRDTGSFQAVASELLVIPIAIQALYLSFISADIDRNVGKNYSDVIDRLNSDNNSIAKITRILMDSFVVAPLSYMERVVAADLPMSLIIAISGFDHAQSPSLIRLVHNQSIAVQSGTFNQQYVRGAATPLTERALKTIENAMAESDAAAAAAMVNDHICLDNSNNNTATKEKRQTDEKLKIIAVSPNTAENVLLGGTPLATNNTSFNNLAEANRIQRQITSGTLESATAMKLDEQPWAAPVTEEKQQETIAGSQLTIISELIQKSPSWVRFVLSSRNKADTSQERSILLNKEPISVKSPIMRSRKNAYK